MAHYEDLESLPPTRPGIDGDFPTILVGTDEEAARAVIEDLEAYALVRSLPGFPSDTETGADKLSTWQIHERAPQGFALALQPSFDPEVTLTAVYHRLRLDPESERAQIESSIDIEVRNEESMSVDEQAAKLAAELKHADLEVVCGMTSKCLDATIFDTKPDNSAKIESALKHYYNVQAESRTGNIYRASDKEEIMRSARFAVRKHAAKELGSISLAVFQIRDEDTLYGRIRAFPDNKGDHTIVDMDFVRQPADSLAETASVNALGQSAVYNHEPTELERDVVGIKKMFEEGQLIGNGVFEEVWDNPNTFQLSARPKLSE